jgi:hypothetical protein
MSDTAYSFFKELEQHLNAAMPGPREMPKAIDEIVTVSKGGRSERHKAFPEGAFLNHFVLPALYRFVAEYPGMDAEKARESLLSESYRKMRDYASDSPARSARHPFDKVVGVSAPGVIRRWNSARALIQSCPDIALRAPFPYRTVFEGKYFRRGGLGAAESALAADIYQAFFYRGLARLPAIKKKPGWDYDYACVLAYDGSESGALLRAWAGLRPKIGKGCWEGARVYVMILRGDGSHGSLSTTA